MPENDEEKKTEALVTLVRLRVIERGRTWLHRARWSDGTVTEEETTATNESDAKLAAILRYGLEGRGSDGSWGGLWGRTFRPTVRVVKPSRKTSR